MSITTYDDLRREVGALLEVAPETMHDDQDLLLLGLDSIRIMSLLTPLQESGADVSFADLAAESTLGAWWAVASARWTEPPAAHLEAARVDEAAPFELTPVQHAYWIGRQDDQVLGGVGCHFYAEFDGQSVEPARLERAVRMLARRHDLLRARLTDDGRQQIMEDCAWRDLPVHDLRECDAVQAALEAVRQGLSHQRLDVASGAVFDLHLSLLPAGRTRLHVSVDLLVADVRSIQILLRDLAALYARRQEQLAPIDFSFSRYLGEQANRGGAAHERGREYWQARVPSLPGGPQLPLAVDPERVERPSFRRRAFTLPASDWERFADRARRHGVTPAMALATAFTEILAAWSADPRFLLNLPTFDRQALDPGVPQMVADFTNLILLEVDASADRSFAARAGRLQAQFRADIDHAQYSGIEVLRDVARARPQEGISAPVVFACNISGGDLVGEEFRRCLGTSGWGISQTPQVWLDHQVMESDGGLFLNWDAVDELFPEGMLDAMFDAYERLLRGLCRSDWSQPTCDLMPASQRLVRASVNATQCQESGRLLHEGFFEQSARAPERVALAWGEHGQLTYGELAARARGIAGLLVAHGVAAGDPVAVTLPKGPEQIAAVLGVLWAGAAYVPVGTDQPLNRRGRIYAKAGVRVVLTSEEERRTAGWPPALDVLDVAEAATAAALTAPCRLPVDALAYVIFTSGSTGEPKGVQISHRAAVNTVEDINERFAVGESDRVLAVSALDFDLSVYDIFGLLSVGGAVVLLEEENRREARRWLALVRRHGVTVWNSVPALLDMLLIVSDDGGSGLRLVLTSGDWVGLDLPGRLAGRWPDCRLIALGGATEAAIWSNAFEVAEVAPEWRSIPYGHPLRNQSYRVVDARGRDCPDWVVGELWIGGSGVADGYRGDPETSARQFVHAGGQRWYRTGDLGRYWSGGTLEFLGRVDQQVKIRGHRIELGEIEAALERHPLIADAIAVAIGQKSKRLAAAIVTAAASPREAGAWLEEQLPAHMVPDRILVLAQPPLTPNGKVDRKQVIDLLERQGQPAQQPFEAPRGHLESTLAVVWGDLLELERVGRNQSFFALGGDSLLATRVVRRLRTLGVHGAELRQLFAKPLLADFAATLSSAGRGNEGSVALAVDREHRHESFRATDVQRAYWTGRTGAFQLGRIGSHFYTEFDGADVDLARLEEAWNRLIARHEMLRAVFDDDGRQRILAKVGRFAIPVSDARENDADALDVLRNEMSHQVLDPARWPLFDVRAVRYRDGRVRLGVSLDNIILDALSVMILFSELGQLYEDIELRLPEIEVSFRDYVIGTQPESQALDASQEYWRERLADLPPAPQLPLRKDPALISRPRFVRREMVLDAATWRGITERAREHELTPSAILLAAYAQVLSAWSTRPDLTLNLTVFDRREVHAHVDRVLGDFTSLFLVAYRPVAGESWLAAVRRLQEQMWRDLDHPDVSAVWVLRELAKRDGVSEVAMPVVFTSALGVTKAVSNPMALPFAELVWGISQTPQVWLDHQVREVDGGLLVNWDAVDDLFPAGMLDAMFGVYRSMLETLGRADWSQPVGDIVPAPQRQLRAPASAAPITEPERVHNGDRRAEIRGYDSELGEIEDGDRRDSELGEIEDGDRRDGELGEIEAVLESHPLIATGVVAATAPSQRRRLVAAIVSVPIAATPALSGELRAAAAGHLPQPSVPRTEATDGDDESRVVEWLLTRLMTAGLGFDGSERARARLAGELGVAERSGPVFELWLQWLESREVLATRGTIVAGGARWDEAGGSARSPERASPGVGDRLALLAATLSERLPVLAAVLRGERDTLTLLDDEVLSPEALIGDDPPTVANVTAIGQQLRELSRSLARPIRVAELGARSGLTAERVLGLVPPDEVAYTLLDSSSVLRIKAQRRLGGFPHQIAFARLDERLVAEGLFHRFDAVIANNALHRFGDVATGLALSGLLLAPGGLLLAVESASLSPLALLSAAVLEQGFAQGAERRGPLLDAARWGEALRHGSWHEPRVIGTGPSLLLRAVQPANVASPALDEVRQWMAARLPAHMVPEQIVVLPRPASSADGHVDRHAVTQLLQRQAELSTDDVDAPIGELELRVAEIWAELLDVPRVGRYQSFFSLGGDSLSATRLVEVTRQRLSADLSLRLLFSAPTVAGIASLITEQRALVEAGVLEEDVI